LLINISTFFVVLHKVTKMFATMKKNIPNTVTSLNLLSGCVALVFVFQDKFEIAAWCIFFAALFDFCDGLAARALKAYSELGVQLDSLADMVSFGVVPAAMLHRVLVNMNPDWLSASVWELLMCIFPFIITIFSALRLAKFNIDKRQHNSFLGLPTPSSAILIISSIVAASKYQVFSYVFSSNILIILFCVIVSVLLVCELPMFALKIKFGESQIIKKNIVQIIFLLAAVVFIILFGYAGISLTIILYILYSIIKQLSSKNIQT